MNPDLIKKFNCIPAQNAQTYTKNMFLMCAVSAPQILLYANYVYIQTSQIFEQSLEFSHCVSVYTNIYFAMIFFALSDE